MTKVAKSNTSSKLIILLIVLILATAAYFLLKRTESKVTASEEQTQYRADTSENLDLAGSQITELDLSLLGTVSGGTPEQSSATIQSRTQVRTYFIGDQIAYSNATLLEIKNDRVILLNEGVKQALLIQSTTL